MSNIDTLVFLLTSTVLTNRILFMQYMYWLLLDDVFYFINDNLYICTSIYTQIEKKRYEGYLITQD
jgi:hypothetical protein